MKRERSSGRGLYPTIINWLWGLVIKASPSDTIDTLNEVAVDKLRDSFSEYHVSDISIFDCGLFGADICLLEMIKSEIPEYMRDYIKKFPN